MNAIRNIQFLLCHCYSLLLLYSAHIMLISGNSQTNTTARSIPAGDARATGIGGLGGLGLPGMERMPDATQLNQIMQNPAISQMMQSLLSNPQYMNQVKVNLTYGVVTCLSLKFVIFIIFSRILDFKPQSTTAWHV